MKTGFIQHVVYHSVSNVPTNARHKLSYFYLAYDLTEALIVVVLLWLNPSWIYAKWI